MSDELPIVRLDQLVELSNEKVAGRKNPNIPYIGLEHIASGSPRILGSISAAESTSVNSVFRPGDILFGKLRPSLKKCVQVDFFGYCSTDILVLRPKSIIDAAFGARILQSDAHFREAVRTSEGTKMPRTSWDRLRQFPVLLPERSEQSAIAETLNTIDSAILQTEAVVNKLESVRKGLLERSVSELISWTEQVALDSLAEVIDPQPDHRTPPHVADGVPYLGVSDIGPDGMIDPSKCRRVSHRAFERQRQRFRIESFDILFGKIGTIGQPRPLAEAANVALSANSVLIKPKTQSTFVYWILQSDHVQRQIARQLHATSQPAFGIERIRKLQVPGLDARAIEEFIRPLADINARIANEGRAVSKLRLIKSGLFGDLLTGRVRIPAIKEATA